MTKQEIGIKLRDERERLGHTPTKVAREITIKTSKLFKSEQVVQIESASKAYTIDTLIRLCEFYGVHLLIG